MCSAPYVGESGSDGVGMINDTGYHLFGSQPTEGNIRGDLSTH